MVIDAVYGGGSGGVLVKHWWGSGGVPVGQLAPAALQLLVESVPWGPCHQPVTCQASIRSFDDDGRFVQRQSQNLKTSMHAILLYFYERIKDQWTGKQCAV
jgi:hypothetical protein